MCWFLMHLNTGLFYRLSLSECFCLPWEVTGPPTKPAIKISFCAQFCQQFLMWQRHKDPVQADLVPTGPGVSHMMQREAMVFIRAHILSNTDTVQSLKLTWRWNRSPASVWAPVSVLRLACHLFPAVWRGRQKTAATSQGSLRTAAVKEGEMRPAL